jgi:ParB-like chromosome segregation protein Spo0J
MSSEACQAVEHPAGGGGAGGGCGAVELVELGRLDRRLSSLRLPSPAQLARLRASVAREGVRSPVIASTAVEAGKLVLLDGFKRVRVLEELEAPAVRVTPVALNAAASAAAILRCNAPHRGLCELEEAWIVKALCREHKVAQVEVSRLLGRHKSWVCRRLKLAESLEEVIQEDIRLGLLSSTVARELVRLPRGNQLSTSHCIRDHGLASRPAAQLVTLLLETGDPEARAALLADPSRFLPARNPPPRPVKDPRLTGGGNELRRGLLSTDAVAQRLLRSCQTYAPAGLDSQDAPVLTLLVEQTLRTGRQLVRQLTQLLVDSKPSSSAARTVEEVADA